MTPLTEIRTPLLREKTDEQLVELTRLGNPAAFETLFRRYSPRLVRFSEHMLGGSSANAEDVVQEVMTSARQAMASNQSPENVRPWLYQATRNRCLNYLRDEGAAKRPRIHHVNGNRYDRDGLDYLDQIAERAPSAHDQAERRAELRQLVDDLRALPETQRTALILRELDGLGYEQMADAMETTIPSVKSLLVRARLGLADMAAGRELDCAVVRVALARNEQRLGNLTPAERAHLRGCEDCTKLREELRATSRSLAALSPIGLSFSLQGALASALGGGGAAAAGGAVAGKAAAGAGAAGVAAGVAGVGGGAGGVAAGGLIAGAGFVAKGLLATVAVSIVAAGSVYLPQTGGSGDEGAAADPGVALPPDPVSSSGKGPGGDDPAGSNAGTKSDPKPGALTVVGGGDDVAGAAAISAVAVEPATTETATSDSGDRGRRAPGDGSSGSRDRPVPDGGVVVVPNDPPPTAPETPSGPPDPATDGDPIDPAPDGAGIEAGTTGSGSTQP
jgi:RNA polymerase sigma factor (sigma-70 family)